MTLLSWQPLLSKNQLLLFYFSHNKTVALTTSCINNINNCIVISCYNKIIAMTTSSISNINNCIVISYNTTIVMATSFINKVILAFFFHIVKLLPWQPLQLFIISNCIMTSYNKTIAPVTNKLHVIIALLCHIIKLLAQ